MFYFLTKLEEQYWILFVPKQTETGPIRGHNVYFRSLAFFFPHY